MKSLETTFIRAFELQLTVILSVLFLAIFSHTSAFAQAPNPDPTEPPPNRVPANPHGDPNEPPPNGSTNAPGTFPHPTPNSP